MCQKRVCDVKLFIVMRYISGAETGSIAKKTQKCRRIPVAYKKVSVLDLRYNSVC
jgi:hypothetical protein